MKSALKQFFLKNYPAADRATRERVMALVYVLLVVAVLSLPLPFVFLEAVIRGCAVGLCALFLLFLLLVRLGRERVVSVVTSPLLCVLFLVIVFSLEYAHFYEIHMATAYILFSIILSIFISPDPRQGFLCMGIGSVGLFLVFFLRVLPLEKSQPPKAFIDDLVISLMIGWLSALVSYLAISRNARLVAEAEEEGGRASGQVRILGNAVAASRDSLELSAQLNESSKATSALVVEMQESVDRAKGEMATLDGKARNLATSLNDIKSGSATLRESAEPSIGSRRAPRKGARRCAPPANP